MRFFSKNALQILYFGTFCSKRPAKKHVRLRKYPYLKDPSSRF